MSLLLRRAARDPAHPRPTRADCDAVGCAGLGSAAVAEVVFAAAAGAFLNRVATLLALPFEAELEGLVEWRAFRLLRPLVAWRMRPKMRRPEPLRIPNEGLGAAAVVALGDSPAAGVLRQTLDDAWASPILPRRTKALLVAVIARALGCPRSERDARRLLAAQGVGASDVDEVLADLAGACLDAREVVLVPFARETVRYQPAHIQRRVREVTAGMDAEEILEVVGVIALANALCHVSVLLE